MQWAKHTSKKGVRQKLAIGKKNVMIVITNQKKKIKHKSVVPNLELRFAFSFFSSSLCFFLKSYCIFLNLLALKMYSNEKEESLFGSIGHHMQPATRGHKKPKLHC